MTPRARRPSETRIQPGEAPRTFEAQQRLLDPTGEEGDDDWMLECFVDLRDPPGDGPLIQLRAVRS